MILVSETPSHHVRRLVMRSLRHHMMRHIISNGNIVLLDYSNATLSLESAFTHGLPVILLGLDDVATEHLWVFYFDLRIVENIIIVVDVLYYFNWLVSLLFLRFGAATAARMRTMHWTSSPNRLR